MFVGVQPHHKSLEHWRPPEAPDQLRDAPHRGLLQRAVGFEIGPERVIEGGKLVGGSSLDATWVAAVRPWVRALQLALALPAAVLGPVLFPALRRLASICRGVAMGCSFFVPELVACIRRLVSRSTGGVA